MLKLFFGLVVTAVAAVLALIPEAAMFTLWHIAQPTTEIGRIVLVLAFVFAGGGLCIFFGFIGFAVWVAGMKVVLE